MQLRHLKLPRIYLPDCPSGSDDKGRHLDFSNLQTISYLSLDCCTKEVIMGIQNVKELGINGYGIPSNGLLNNLVHLQQLETLSFILCFNLLPAKAFPATLKKLKLERTFLHWSYLDIIAELPNLEVLKLMDYACRGEEWHPNVRGFARLKVLLIEDCFLKYTLQLIELRECLPKLAESAALIQKEQAELGNNPVDVRTSDPYDPDDNVYMWINRSSLLYSSLETRADNLSDGVSQFTYNISLSSAISFNLTLFARYSLICFSGLILYIQKQTVIPRVGISIGGLQLQQVILKWWDAPVLPGLQPIFCAVPAIIIWELWKKRNSNKHGEKVTQVCWNLPLDNWLKCNTDGVSRDNPGRSSYAFCIRDPLGDLIYAEAKETSEGTNTFSETIAILEAARYCVAHNVFNLILETDSLFLKNIITGIWKPPWSVTAELEEIGELLENLNVQVTHVMREGNQLADYLANRH
ncbi:hypothetical protein FXO37_11716 [Capsicum annuum]|nr:hypothetical protein FXO37_11716 [Capsicum annuum]